MKKTLLPLFTAIISILTACTDGEITLLSDGVSDYSIVIPAGANPVETKVAEEFCRLFEMGSGVKLPIITDDTAPAKHEIAIGNTNRKDAAGPLSGDGFLIETSRGKLFISGGDEKGVLYGTYTFFDTYLGYRCYSPEVFKFPSFADLKLAGDIYDLQNPVNVYRNNFCAVANDPFYADWHKLDHMKPDWGIWVHTFDDLLPASEYFDEHPEYFALVDGKRTGMQDDGHLHSQLCLSNPEVLRIVTENLGKKMEKQPEAIYWSVSQSDTYPEKGYNCTCEECAKLDEASSSPSGSIITFVNKIAEQFPDNIISTLAYRYSRAVPTAVKPDSNVNIMLCNIECFRNISIEDDPSSAGFRKDFEDWGKIADNILMWDYVVQFMNLMAPFPNLRTLQPNIQYYVRNGVTAHLQLGNVSRGGEFSDLKPYLISRLLWNPDVDIEAEMRDFLEGYYEEAAPYIYDYINLMHDELEASGKPLEIYGRPYDHFEGFLSTELMEKYEALLDKAEQAVASKPDVLERVQVVRLQLTYALFDIAQKRELAETRIFEKSGDKWQIRGDALARLDAFRELCNKTGVKHLREGGLPPDEYHAYMKQSLEEIVAR